MSVALVTYYQRSSIGMCLPMLKVMMLALVHKTIGKNVYQYEVKWDSESKKQRWQYVGKILTNEVSSPSTIGNPFTNVEKAEVRDMLEWIEARKHRQSGCAYRETASMLLKRLDLSDR